MATRLRSHSTICAAEPRYFVDRFDVKAAPRGDHGSADFPCPYHRSSACPKLLEEVFPGEVAAVALTDLD